MTTNTPKDTDAPKGQTASKTSTDSTRDKGTGGARVDAKEAARTELHGGALGGITMPAVFGDDLFEQYADAVRSDPRYHIADPNDPSDRNGSTGSAGSNPPPPVILQYGDGPNDYISTVFDSGQAIVQDGNDPSGKAWKYPEESFRRFAAKIRGEELPEDEKEQGPSQYEAAAEQNQRTFQMLADEREAGRDVNRPETKNQ